MQCQTQLVGRAVTAVNHRALNAAESEKSLKFEGAEFARELFQTQVGGVPAVHCLYPSLGTLTIRDKELA